MGTEISTAQIIARLAIGMVVMATAFFGSAGTVSWPEAWIYLILQFSFSGSMAFWLKKNDPQLLKDRMAFLKPSARRWDKIILWMATFVFVPYLLLPGLDAVRYRWSSVPSFVKAFAFVGIAANLLLISRVLHENRYLTSIVEIQKERGHKVITSGPYRFVRHPMYVAVIMILFCIPVALGALLDLIPATVLAILFVIRTHLEDRTLQAELEGYRAYSEKVRYRLVPGIW